MYICQKHIERNKFIPAVGRAVGCDLNIWFELAPLAGDPLPLPNPLPLPRGTPRCGRV